MKNTLFIITALIVIYFVFSIEKGYSQERKGQIEGIVSDASTGDVLPYSNVFIDGTTIGCSSDDKGFYAIKLLKPGAYKLKASFIGYRDTLLMVKVDSGKVSNINISLSLNSKTTETINITVQAYGQVKAINSQISSKTIKNIVSEEKIRELPDANAAEALARLPGVSIEREGGEASRINIRGVSSNTKYVNGMRMEGDLMSISPSMIGRIELSKAFLPDQDADVLGGSIEIKMREATSGFKTELWLRQGYNSFSKSFKMQDVSLLLSNRFFDNKLGVLLSLSYDRKDRGRDILDPNYEFIGSGDANVLKEVKLTDVRLAHHQNLNNRYGVTLFTDYKLSNGKLFYHGFLSGLSSENKEAANVYSATGIPSIRYNSTYYNASNLNFMNGIGGEHFFNQVKVDWGGYFSQTISSTPDRLNYNAFNNQGMGNNSTNLIDSSTTVEQFIALGTHDLSKTAVDGIYTWDIDNFNKEFGSKLNIEIPFSVNKKVNGYVKLGGKFRNINRASKNYTKETNLRSGAFEHQLIRDNLENRTPEMGWSLENNTKLSDGNYGHAAFAGNDQPQDFSLVNTKTYYFPDFNKVEFVKDRMFDLFGHQIQYDKDDYENNEKYYAGYIMAGLNITDLITFTPGVRYEKNVYSTTARYFTSTNTSPLAPPGQQGEFRDTTDGNSNSHWFPMVHLKIKPVEWFDIRLGYTKTLTRPTFDNMSPRYFRDQNYNVSEGNVNLKPQINYNYDIYLSFYSTKIGLFTVGAFYKRLEDQFFSYTLNGVVNPENYGLPSQSKNKNYSRVINNEKPGFVQGLEFDWQTQFSYLPYPFNGITLNANVTFMQSETEYPFYQFYYIKQPAPVFKKAIGVDTTRLSPIIQMPKMVGSLSLGYELGGFSGRISAFYQKPTLAGVTANQISLDETKHEILRFDLQVSQSIRKIKGLSFYLNINNLTNASDKVYLTFYTNKTAYEEKYGVSGDIGVRYKF
jgi:TonB-dependent receptor